MTNTGLVVEVAPVVVVVVEGLVVVGARVIVVVVEVEVVVVVVVEVVVGVVEVLMVVGVMVVEGRGARGVGGAVKAEARGASVSSTTREEGGESKWLKTRQQKHQTVRHTQER